MTGLVALVALVLLAVPGLARRGNLCIEDGVCFETVEVVLFPNGGPANDTDVGLTLEVKVSAGPEGMYDIFENAGRAYFGAGPKGDRSLPVDVYAEDGVMLVNTSAVRDGQMLFLVPTLPQVFPKEAGRDLFEPFVWPSIRVGHRVQMSDVPLFLETLSVSPRVFIIDDFLSPAEADAIVAFARREINMGRAGTVAVKGHHDVINNARTSTHGWIKRMHVEARNAFGAMMRGIDQRVARVTRLARPELHEPLQVVHYADASQFYWSHHDYFEDPENIRTGSNRFITFFFYLNDVDDGGATVFSHAGPTGYGSIRRSELKDCSRGLAVQPRKGRAAFWYNLQAGREPVMAGKTDTRTRHGGCPPISGEKWGANRWVWNWVPAGTTKQM